MKRQPTTRRTITASALGLLVMMATGLPMTTAGDEATFAPPPQPEPDLLQVSDAELQQVADAHQALTQIQKRMAQEVAGEENQAVIQAHVEAAQPEMEQAITQTGLTLDSYQRLVQAIAGDETLRARFMALIEVQQPVAARQPAEAAAVSDQDLERAAQAYNRINAINQNLQQGLEGETDQDVIQQQVAAAETSMQQAVIDAGLSIERYNAIMQAVQQDAALQQKLGQLLNL